MEGRRGSLGTAEPPCSCFCAIDFLASGIAAFSTMKWSGFAPAAEEGVIVAGDCLLDRSLVRSSVLVGIPVAFKAWLQWSVMRGVARGSSVIVGRVLTCHL